MLKHKISLSTLKMDKQETGILLLAIGHPYYGRMAYNLAMSIKAIEPFAHITLVYTDSAIAHINKRNMWVFDNKMPIADTSEPFGVKLLLNNLSPYDRTLFFDVDTLWVHKTGPSKLFDQLKGVSFTGITEGFHDYSDPSLSDPSKHYFFWGDLDEIRQSWAIKNTIFQWRSEFIYFEKCEKTDAMFNLAKSVYADPKIKSVKKFADHVPDELAFNISCAIYGISPHKYKWQPTYWDMLNGGNMPPIEELREKYYLVSCGSHASYGALKRVYDNVSSKSAFKLKLQHVFPLISKKEMLTNRQLM